MHEANKIPVGCVPPVYQPYVIQPPDVSTGWGRVGPVADPGFPRGGGANSPGGHTILPYFPKNCMKLKEFGFPGGTSLVPPLDPPLGSQANKFQQVSSDGHEMSLAGIQG